MLICCITMEETGLASGGGGVVKTSAYRRLRVTFLVVLAGPLVAAGSVTGPAQAVVPPSPAVPPLPIRSYDPYCESHPEDVQRCSSPLPGELLNGDLDCLTGADTNRASSSSALVPPAERFSTPLLPGPYAIVATPNQRFGVLTKEGALAFRPSFREVGHVVTLPTDRGVSIAFVEGVSPTGRYGWTLPLEPGQRFKRRHGRLLLVGEDGRAILGITVRGGSTAAERALRAPTGSSAAAAQGEEPPSAGSDGDGFYFDYAEGSDIDGLNVAPIGDPDPFDCSAAQTPGPNSQPTPDGGVSVEMQFGDGAAAASGRRPARARAALVGRCTGSVSTPFQAGSSPGFFGYEYGRATLGCDAAVRATLKVTKLKLSRLVNGSYRGRRTRTRPSFTGANSLTQTRTVCRNSSLQKWRAGARFTVYALTKPFIQTRLARAYSSNFCA